MIKLKLSVIFCILSVYNSFACSFTIVQTSVNPTCGDNGGITVSLSPTPTAAVNFAVTIDGQGYYNTNGLLISLQSLKAGTYKVIIHDPSTNCTDSTSIILSPAVNAFTVSAVLDSPTCTGRNDGKITLLLSNATIPVSYKWSHSTTELDSIAQNIPVGSYNVTATDASGCIAKLTNIKLVELQNRIVMTDTTITMGTCGHDTGKISLAWTGGYYWTKFKWYNSDSFNMPLDSLPLGKYSCLIWDSLQCHNILVSDIEIKQPDKPKAQIYGTDSICPLAGFGTLYVKILQGDSATMTYKWSYNATNTTNTAAGIVAGDYIVTVTDKVGCIDTPKKTVYNYPEKTVTLSGKTPIVANESEIITIVDPTGLSNISWTPSANTKPAKNGLLVAPTISTYYIMEATYGPGCIVKSQYYIEVDSDKDDLVIPNIFTPNGDYQNDEYYLIGSNNTIISFEIRIYDRWGNNVFASYDQTFKWDGTSNGKEVEQGVYTYMIKYNTTHSNYQNIIKKGTILLAR